MSWNGRVSKKARGTFPKSPPCLEEAEEPGCSVCIIKRTSDPQIWTQCRESHIRKQSFSLPQCTLMCFSFLCFAIKFVKNISKKLLNGLTNQTSIVSSVVVFLHHWWHHECLWLMWVTGFLLPMLEQTSWNLRNPRLSPLRRSSDPQPRHNWISRPPVFPLTSPYLQDS